MDLNIKQHVDRVLAQPMDRREFLARAGAVVLTVVGVTGAIKAFSGGARTFTGSNGEGGRLAGTDRPGGYGASPYGR